MEEFQACFGSSDSLEEGPYGLGPGTGAGLGFLPALRPAEIV